VQPIFFPVVVLVALVGVRLLGIRLGWWRAMLVARLGLTTAGFALTAVGYQDFHGGGRRSSGCAKPSLGGRCLRSLGVWGMGNSLPSDEPATRTTGPFLRHEHELAIHRVGELMTYQPAAAKACWPLTRAVGLIVQ
jgi:hypothetical protein